ncbi:MAG: hypothetical protein IJW97_04990, partial [Clostridia bacterium]|nr:hypothetical protein [Clostridia bacterium]
CGGSFFSHEKKFPRRSLHPSPSIPLATGENFLEKVFPCTPFQKLLRQKGGHTRQDGGYTLLLFCFF